MRTDVTLNLHLDMLILLSTLVKEKLMENYIFLCNRLLMTIGSSFGQFTVAVSGRCDCSHCASNSYLCLKNVGSVQERDSITST